VKGYLEYPYKICIFCHTIQKLLNLTMACLVRQLFRMKIGKDVDQALIDDVMFPLLLTQRTKPLQLLQDIKLTRGPSDYVDNAGRHKEESLILLEEDLYVNPGDGVYNAPISYPENIVHFTPKPIGLRGDVGSSPTTIRWRWRPSLRGWGTIDIVNKLRSLKHPHVDRNSYHRFSLEERPRMGKHGEISADDIIEETLSNGVQLLWTCDDFSGYMGLQIIRNKNQIYSRRYP